MLANFSNLITFSRGSNATVTDASGQLTYAANNLLTNSETFEATSSWLVGTNTITANTIAAPNGSVTADTFTATATGSGAFVRQIQTAAASTRHIVSVYFKRGTADFANITVFDGTNGNRYWFNLVNGTVASTAVVGAGYTGLSAAIQDAGNGWYRCSVTFTNGSTTTFNLFATFTNADASLDVTSGRTGYLWGAQLEAVTYQTTPSPYVSTSVANLLGFSEAFDNAAWTKSNASIVTGAAQNPINQLWNAQKLMENTAASSHYALQAVSALAITYTLSIYAKAGERSFASLGFDGLNAWFNLSAGTLGAVEAGLTASITSVGNGWYRCSVTRTVTSAGSKSCVIYSATANNVVSYTGDGNSGIYIYGAQLSNSGSLDPYVPTPGAAPSSTAYYGPRFDYDPVTLAAKGILIEEQRTNLLTYSEQFDNAAWTKTAATITANSAVAPDGTTTADTITEDTTAASAHRVLQSITTTAAAWTASIYVKAGTRSWFYIRLTDSGSVARYAYFNVSTGVLGTVETNLTATITAAGNGWYRCSATVSTALAGSNPCVFALTDANGNPAYNGNGTGSLYFWGAQLEAGAFATSYIPTVASTVTRSADVATITGSLFSGWYNQAQGTFLINVDSATTGYRTNLQVDDGTLNNRILIQTNNVATAQQYYVVVGGSAVVNTSAQSYSPSGSKTSAAYALNDYAYSVNGATPTADTSATVPPVTRLFLGTEVSSNYLNGHIRSIQYIPNATSAAQLQAATS